MTSAEGGKSCYWCGEWIPYTTHPLHWWCFACHRYTENTVPEEDQYIGHICRWKVIPGPKLVMYACTSTRCPRTFTSSLSEYERDLKAAGLAEHFHSQEFHAEVQQVIAKGQELRAERRANLYAQFEREMGKLDTESR